MDYNPYISWLDTSRKCVINQLINWLRSLPAGHPSNISAPRTSLGPSARGPVKPGFHGGKFHIDYQMK